MKKIITLIFIMSLIVNLIQAQDTMYVHQTGGNIIKVACNQIDSVIFYGSGISGPTVTDIDGNVYNIVTIGSQEWIAQNLKTTRFNDGSAIPNVTANDDWIILDTPGYCWYNNDEGTYKSLYGALYNWHAAANGNLCPEGWHVPTDDEWTVLTDYLGGENAAGGKLKEVGTVHWNSPNTGATNETGFTALPGGKRFGNGGDFGLIQDDGYWWSFNEAYPSSAWYRKMSNSSAKVNRHHLGKNHGHSVRCLKN